MTAAVSDDRDLTGMRSTAAPELPMASLERWVSCLRSLRHRLVSASARREQPDFGPNPSLSK